MKWLIAGAMALAVLPVALLSLPGVLQGRNGWPAVIIMYGVIVFICIGAGRFAFSLLNRRIEEIQSVSQLLETCRPEFMRLEFNRLRLLFLNIVELIPDQDNRPPVFVSIRSPRKQSPHAGADRVEVYLGPPDAIPQRAAVRAHALFWGEAMSPEEIRAKNARLTKIAYGVTMAAVLLVVLISGYTLF